MQNFGRLALKDAIYNQDVYWIHTTAWISFNLFHFIEFGYNLPRTYLNIMLVHARWEMEKNIKRISIDFLSASAIGFAPKFPHLWPLVYIQRRVVHYSTFTSVKVLGRLQRVDSFWRRHSAF